MEEKRDIGIASPLPSMFLTAAQLSNYIRQNESVFEQITWSLKNRHCSHFIMYFTFHAVALTCMEQILRWNRQIGLEFKFKRQIRYRCIHYEYWICAHKDEIPFNHYAMFIVVAIFTPTFNVQSIFFFWVWTIRICCLMCYIKWINK